MEMVRTLHNEGCNAYNKFEIVGNYALLSKVTMPVTLKLITL